MSLSGPSGPGVFLLVSGPRERGEEVGGWGGGGEAESARGPYFQND